MPDPYPAKKPPLTFAYVDTKGTSALTGLSESTLEKQRLTSGGIPYIKAGRLVKYSVADIHAWMAARRRCSTSETREIAAPVALTQEQTMCSSALTGRATTSLAADSAGGEG